MAPGKEDPSVYVRFRDPPFEWIGKAFRNRRTMKLWARTVVAVMVGMILVADGKTMRSMERASFFLLVVGVLLTPNMALSIFIIACLSLMIGELLGWVWGIAAMRAATVARSQSLIDRQTALIKSMLDPHSDITLEKQANVLVLHGYFLDPRSSAIYGVFLFFGNFAFAAIRAYLPNLTLLSVFGAVVLDLYCTSGPLLPGKDYGLGKIFIIPSAYYCAVAIASVVFIFPESLSHIWLTSLKNDYWDHVMGILRLESTILKTVPSDHTTWSKLTMSGQAIRMRFVQDTNALLSQLGLIGIDWSLCRLAPADLRRISAQLKNILFGAVGLHAFAAFVNDVNRLEQEDEFTSAYDTKGKKDDLTHRFKRLRRDIRDREHAHGHGLASLISIVEGSTSNLRSASQDAVEGIVAWLGECNSHRWSMYFGSFFKGKRERQEREMKEGRARLAAKLEGLKSSLQAFRKDERKRIVGPYEKFFDPVTGKLLASRGDPRAFASRSLFMAFVFIDSLDSFAEKLVAHLELLLEIDSMRGEPRFWYPGRFAQMKEVVSGNQFEETGPRVGMGETTDITRVPEPSPSKDAESEGEKVQNVLRNQRRNPDASPPTTKFGVIASKFLPVFRFLLSPQGLFSLRVGLVSVVLWIPAVCHSSAYFYYSHKGIWAVIMGQTAMAMYAGDQIVDFVLRFMGSCLGCGVGIAAWYIGRGSNQGNGYGEVAAVTVLLSPFMLARVAAPREQFGFWSMGSINVVLVAAYSYVDSRMQALGNPGYGAAFGYKRTLTVIIGFTTAFIVMLFPNPGSSRVRVRKTLASVMSEVGQVFAEEVEVFVEEEAKSRRAAVGGAAQNAAQGAKMKESRVKKVNQLSERVLVIGARLRDVTLQLGTAGFEPNLAGPWPVELYRQLFEAQLRVLGSLLLLVNEFSKLDPEWSTRLVYKTSLLNPNFLSDVFTTVQTIASCLMSGQPLPAYLPKLRDRIVYHERCFRGAIAAGRSGRLTGRASASAFASTGSLPLSEKESSWEEGAKVGYEKKSPSLRGVNGKKGSSDDLDDTVARIDGISIGFEEAEVGLDMFLDSQLPAYSSAIVAISSIIARIDEISEIARALCGESTALAGYEVLHREYLDREEREY